MWRLIVSAFFIGAALTDAALAKDGIAINATNRAAGDITLSNQPDTISLTSVYTIVREKKTWDEALRSCKNLGGSLATFTSLHDFNRLLEMMKLWGNTDSDGYYWIGAKVTEGSTWWKWLSGEPIPRPEEAGFAWQETTYDAGECMTFETYMQDSSPGFCGGHQCSDKQKYICESKQ